VLPGKQGVGSLFLPAGVSSFTLGLLFLLPFARNETDPLWSMATQRVLGIGGALLALAGFIGGSVSADFLVSKGLPLGVLGLCYVWAFVGLAGAGNQVGYRAGLGLGAVGLLVFLVALGRSVLPPLFHAWGWISSAPAPYLVPGGLVLMGLGLVYLLVGIGICLDTRLVVLTRRELASFFYSPIAYIVLIGIAFIGWYQFWRFVSTITDQETPLRNPEILIEPIVRSYIFSLFPIIAVIFLVPVLTMRLLSEEKRTGTLEVLLTAPVPETTVVLSKFVAALIMYVLVWLPWGLYLVALRVEGGREFDYRPLLTFFIALVCTGAHFISMGVFFSSLTRNQIAAAILTFLGMMFLTTIAIIADMKAVRENAGLSAVLTHISYIELWSRSMNGTVVPRLLVFHLSATVFWLFLTIKVLDARKWS
jgi:ABC-type transport system involved in multi-copper enzyme maturation permease subunit